MILDGTNVNFQSDYYFNSLRLEEIRQENTDDNSISIFLNKKCKIRQIFHLRLFLGFFTMRSQHWLKKWIGADLAPSPFLDQ